MEDLPGTVPLLQGRWQLRGRDVQVDGYQRDADQTHMDPPLSHLSGEGGLIPASERRRQKQPCPGTIPTGEATKIRIKRCSKLAKNARFQEKAKQL